MKKLTTILLAAILCASALAGCGNDSGSSGEAENPSSEAASTAESGGGETAKTPDELLHEKYEEPVKITFVLSYRRSAARAGRRFRPRRTERLSR